jgi:hypothetical protein
VHVALVSSHEASPKVSATKVAQPNAPIRVFMRGQLTPQAAAVQEINPAWA